MPLVNMVQEYFLKSAEDGLKANTELGNQRVLARLGWEGDNVGALRICYSEIGMNCLTHAPKPRGFRLWM